MPVAGSASRVIPALYKIELYVPESHLTAVKTAMFEAGAGRVGNYDLCAWQTRGEGQFRPLDGSRPFWQSRSDRNSD